MTTAKDHVRLLRDLRSVRRFRQEAVPQEAIDDLLEVARWTGSSSNRQPWELVLVRDRETLRALGAVSGQPGPWHLADAAMAVVLVMSGADIEFDAGRCAERIMLALAAHGIGSSIAGFLGTDQVAAAKAILGVPADCTLRVAISAGHPADASAHLVSAERDVDTRFPLARLRVGRKPLAEILHVERYGERSKPR